MTAYSQVSPRRAILLLSCPDQKGLVARLSNFVFANGGNIVDSDHHTDFAANRFLARFEWDLEGFAIPRTALSHAVGSLMSDIGADWALRFSDVQPRLAIFVTRQDHCLWDLLWRQRAGELDCAVPVIVSNHEKLRPVADQFGIEFCHIPVAKGAREEAEAQQLELLQAHAVDLVVMAKYMQVLSSGFLSQAPAVINIHHSFLPAFQGAKPYHRAHERGVKIIGATAHYATADLDEGPIIEQGVVRVSHRDTVGDLIRQGRDIERTTLARAVRLHLHSRVMTYGNRTAVFA
ncbi:MAG: formyltetrahydrofolate deformylase [Myxococcota bacterium]